MRDKVLAACRQLFAPGDRVVCALSGGGDSVALTHCLLSLRQELGISVAAAHFNHCLRNPMGTRPLSGSSVPGGVWNYPWVGEIPAA